MSLRKILEISMHNPLQFDFALKRLLCMGQLKSPSSVFETCHFFERKSI